MPRPEENCSSTAVHPIKKYLMEKIFKYSLLFLAGVLFVLLFIIKDIDGDIGNIYWRLTAAKMHLANDFAMPYFTPVRCGGFLLAADAQDFIFSLYMLLNFLIINVVWTFKITNLLLSILLASGVCVWLKYFDIFNPRARLFTGILVSVSGYWVYNMTQSGHAWSHGLAYTPWVMVFIEELLQQKPRKEHSYLLRVWALIAFFFLLINSGYYWLQVAVPMIGARLLTELLAADYEKKEKIKRLGMVIAAGVFALVLSWPRLGGVYEFQFRKFPREGGAVGYMQVMGDTVGVLKTIFISLFDKKIIIDAVGNPCLGFFWDYTMFIGILALPVFLLGLTRAGKFLKSKAFIALFLASVFQFAMTRTTHAVDLVRFFVPIYTQISWYWRGSAILVFFACVFVAMGYEILFKKNHKVLLWGGFLLMVLNLGEMGYTHLKQMDFSMNPPLRDIFKEYRPLAKPLTINSSPCMIGGIFGYGNECPIQNRAGGGEPACGLGNSVYAGGDAEHYNMNDVRRLASPEADHAFYMKHDWPLWPKKDKEEFERFINYKQVIQLPMRLRIMNIVSGLAWLGYLAAFGLVLRLRK